MKSPVFPLRSSVVDHVVQRGVRESVAVGREEVLVVSEVRADTPQALADRGLDAGVHERDPPVGDVRRQELHVASTVREHEVVGERLVVVRGSSP